MPAAISVVTLLTDFGERDYFVPSMKGVILGINSQARVVDLTHQIPPFDLEKAAYFLKSCYQNFPDGTVHVVVVDPEVGTDRRPLLVTTSRHFFVGPDNGVFSYIFKQEPSVEVRQIENKQYRLDAQGATFDGRDLFAPAAAWLTRGQVPGSYGRLIRDYVQLPLDEAKIQGKVLRGKIVCIDHFGNLISNIGSTELDSLRDMINESGVTIQVGNLSITDLKVSYAQGSADTPEALINSNGYLEIFLKEGHAAQRIGGKLGDVVEVKGQSGSTPA